MKVLAAIALARGILSAVTGAVQAGRDDITEDEIDTAMADVQVSGDDLQAAIDAARRREADDA